MLQMGLKEPVIIDVQVLTSRLTVPSPPIYKSQNNIVKKSIENKTDQKNV